jgi:glycosyltransferase involved in cell wall biosynthesis
MKRRALVSAQWIPEFDRNRGAQRVDAMIRFLVDDGWSVQFLSERHEGDDWHVERLRKLGVATFVGYEEAENVVRAGNFDLAVLAFWQPAERLIPVLRQLSPDTRILVDTIDLHFLRDARRSFGIDGQLDSEYGATVVRELNTYQQADALLATSAKETEWLNDIIGPGRAHWMALEEPVTGEPPPLEGRRGILFVGYFRHLPNGEAVEYLCRDILPLIDPDLLDLHPLTVVGSGLNDSVRAYAKNLRDVEMIGWVPSVFPYFARARVCAFPLLHGAGVKGKLLQAFMMGTPVVTTRIGVEGLGVTSEQQVIVAESAREAAAAITDLLIDSDEWTRISEAARRYVLDAHDEAAVRQDFLAIVSEVISQPASDHSRSPAWRHGQRRRQAYLRTLDSVTQSVASVTEPGEVVLVVSKGDDELLAFDGRIPRHFPEAADGRWAGFHPKDSNDAIRLLEEQRRRGARYFVLPETSFWWIHHYREFTRHLNTQYTKLHADEAVLVYDLQTLAGAPEVSGISTADSSAIVVGTYGDDQDDPPSDLVEALNATRGVRVTQEWRALPDTEGRYQLPVGLDVADADWVVYVDSTAVVQPGFLDDFLNLAARLGAERAQPTHSNGPSVVPVGERLRGCVARQVPARLPIPVFAVRSGAPIEGPVTLIEATSVDLRTLQEEAASIAGLPAVTEVYVHGPAGFERAVHRSTTDDSSPAISVLIATYQRPSLLDACLKAFCEQSLDQRSFEIVVIDDGSLDDETVLVLKGYEDRLPLVWARIDHAGRSAAKNLAVLLARAEIVLFFDDDDRPHEDLLRQHLLAHRESPHERAAVLGFTEWAPELERSPLMHYLTDVDRLLFSYGSLQAEVAHDWRCFWEGRISCKRRLLLLHGLHDQRLNYSIDVEMAWRLREHGLEVRYWPEARSYMARALDLDDFCARMEGKGRAQALIASLHPTEEMLSYTKVEGARDRWESSRGDLAALVERVGVLEQELVAPDQAAPDVRGRLEELHRDYRAIFEAFYAKGVCTILDSEVPTDGVTLQESGRRPDEEGKSHPELTVVVPVWSRTSELAEMARETIERVWSVSQVPTEVIVIDNGSPYEVPLRATVHRFEENRGVSTAWNVGASMARAPVLAFLNSDCMVEEGWDVALMEAATTGRRIGFPYTDHGDGKGFRMPDQGGTAGWCFALTSDLFDEIGPFDERFNPAYGEDTDYWHRAWEMGIELSPVPMARVRHTRRATAKLDPHVDWLLQGHRYKYGWKHGVDPLRAPPYYNRSIIEYHCRGQVEPSRG